MKGTLTGQAAGWLLLAGGSFRSDRSNEALLTDAQLRAQAATPGQERTYLCVPPGSGNRIGIDRDEDGYLDRDEIAAGSDPADPSSTPSGGTTTTATTTSTTTTSTTQPQGLSFIPIPTKKLVLKDRSTFPSNPAKRKVAFKSDTRGPAFLYHIDPPFQGSPTDPRTVGATVVVYNSVGPGGDLAIVGLPASGWIATGPNSYKYRGPLGAPITRATLKPDQLAFKGGKAQWNYSLNEASQGRVAAAMIVSNVYYCSDAPAKVSGNPPSTATSDHTDKFVAEPNTAAPPFCVSP